MIDQQTFFKSTNPILSLNTWTFYLKYLYEEAKSIVKYQYRVHILPCHNLCIFMPKYNNFGNVYI
jgi:hypothetical protein